MVCFVSALSHWTCAGLWSISSVLVINDDEAENIIPIQQTASGATMMALPHWFVQGNLFILENHQKINEVVKCITTATCFMIFELTDCSM